MARRPRSSRRQSMCYHVYNRGLDRRTLFHDDADFARFSQTVRRYKAASAGVRLFHWAWMGNHYHMVLGAPFPLLRPFVAGVQQSYAQYYRRRYGTCGPLWQGRFHSRPIDDKDLCLTRCGRYAERNAVRAGLVAVAWDWPWCSATFYVLGDGDGDACGGLTDLDPQFDAAAGLGAHERADYRAMLLDTADERWMAEHGRGVTIGSPSFATRLTLEQGRPAVRRGRPRRLTHAGPTGIIGQQFTRDGISS